MSEQDALRALVVCLASLYLGWEWEEVGPDFRMLRTPDRLIVATEEYGKLDYSDGLPALDLNLMWQIEEVIKARGLIEPYIRALGWNETIYTYGALFALVCAPADVRARAALSIIEGAE